MKLWDKGVSVDKAVEQFTVGNDYELDKHLVKHDCRASIAHARMLKKMGVLSKEELRKTEAGLQEILELSAKGKFAILPEDEDCHTAIENFLTKKYGEVGKKIHTCRSRNDQVLTALRLYEKEALSDTKKLLCDFQKQLGETATKNSTVPLPGYTHMQKAMPTTVGVWLGSFVHAAADDVLFLNAVAKMIDQNPLGSAASFGVPVFAVDKKMTAKEMGFSRVMENPLHAQMSRGKFEMTIASLLTQIMLDMNHLATDLMLFSMQEFGFVSLPVEFCTGSSIMPQKKNPDVLELARAKYHVVVGEEMKIKGIVGNLMSGYNRDMQLTKEPLMNAFEITKFTLSIMTPVVSGMTVNVEKCKKAMTPELYATEEAYKLVKGDLPFREAYRLVGEKYGGS
ncbi:argininosuccinate lyase [Candidatus Woesearchaeota archaeon]|nr:argininosuccinate lyase [Candidatus Woesearchaeota archaeon]